MRPAQRWSSVMAATDLGARLRGVLELLAVFLIIMCLLVIALNTQRQLVARAQTSEAFMVTSGLRIKMTTEHALTGQWSAVADSTGDSWRDTAGRFTRAVNFQPGGGLNVELLEQGLDGAIAGRVITMRPFFYGAPGATLIIWSCGSHTPPVGYVSQAPDATTVPVEYLPNHCRDR